jgi:hypothetical protein
MKTGAIAHFALGVYVFVGCISAYRLAKSTLKKSGSTWAPSPLSRLAMKSLFVIMPISAVAAFSVGWHAPILPQLIGGTMNMVCFYAGCVGVLAKRRTPSEQAIR